MSNVRPRTEAYQQWIHEHFPTFLEARNHCVEATIAMQKRFPELQRVRGHYYDGPQERAHWWLIDSAGNIVDPTAAQFQTKGHGIYDERDETEPEPTGKCHHCGNLVYNGEVFCSRQCATEAASSMVRKG
jgi:hypothetical protein